MNNGAWRLFWKRLILVVAAAALMTSCVFNFVTAPLIMCLMDGGCEEVSVTSLRGMYARTIAVACFASASALLCKYGTTMSIYKQTMEAHDVYSPTTEAERRDRALFCVLYVTLCMSVTLPINALRLSLLYRNRSDPIVLVFFVFMYLENVVMCLGETCFVTWCRTLSNKFLVINRDLQLLGEEMATVNDTAAGKSITTALIATTVTTAAAGRRVTYGGDFYGGPREQSIANAVEVIRIRHQLIRDALSVLVDLFGLPVGLSLLTLGVMTLFDIYYQVSDIMGADSRLMIFIYIWLLQYTIRFSTIVLTAHYTTKQALKSKIFITDINNRYLDSNTKEELQIFLNQLSNCSIEITAYDFITLNTHLITSAIVAGTTYLVILLQFDSNDD
ncbi:putative gustatory receptor 28b [Acyrthosiphon pisum]|uniref:Gustatory receptor n=1 Tax=Acyrthosiphon pisum TaxID=7029 RepID=A0A8R1X2H9_ACYPI|nr:putative gustatory receptor 28b [Acyrthosiphon pisum]|eukprot:XP_008178128.1 PREDICTED: putative gustatory receptor 28b [Acyrthosiphon pisum]